MAAAAAIGGCGASQKAAPPVRLTVDGPPDMALLRGSSVDVHGVVAPASAHVAVDGKTVRVRGGRFASTVPLRPGTNLIDVVAGAGGGAKPAMVALRVRRQVMVTVPDLTDYTPADAKDRLASLGLQADIKKAGGIIEFLLPESAHVCDTQPQAGSNVPPGTTVTVFAAKQC